MKTIVQLENNSKIRKGASTKLPVFDMITKGITTRQAFRFMIPELIDKADQFLKAGALELSVGTYTAKDIHRFLNKTYKNYYQEDTAPLCLFTQSCPIDINCKQWIVEDHGVYSFPWFKAFYVLSNCETQAAWSGPKAHKFIVEDKRECVSESIITFSDKKQAKKLSTMVRKNNFPKDKPCQLSLSDGCIRCTYSASRGKDHKGRIQKRRIEAYDGYLLSPSEYTVPDNCSDICVRFDAQQLRHLYGECKIRIFTNEKGDGSIQNPYNIRVTIENPDGWIVASDVIEYKIKYLSFEDVNEKRHESAQNETSGNILNHAENLHNHEFINDIKEQKDDPNALTILSAYNQNERTRQIHQTAQLCLPYRKLSSLPVVPSREELIKQASPLSSSPVINHLCMQIEIVQMDKIRKLYGVGKLRVHIKKALNSHNGNPYNVFLQIETAEGWIVNNEFLRHKNLTPISSPLPAPHAEARTVILPNHLPATRQFIRTWPSSTASIHKTVFGLAATKEAKKYGIPTTHTPIREDIEHSVKNLQISRTDNE